MISILNEDGSCQEDYQSIVSDNDLLKIIKTAIFNRVFDARMLTLQRQGRLGFYLGSYGEETFIIGCSSTLKNNDPAFLSYRELGLLLWRGVPLTQILNQYIGNNQDLCKGRQMPVHYSFREFGITSVSSPLGTQLPHACGYAYASKLKNRNEVCIAFLGEGTTSGSDFPVSLNFSAVLNTPTLYVIRNNGYAISTPQSKQYKGNNLADRVLGYGIPGVQIDGNDILIVIKTLKEAVEKIRAGGGPMLIEGLTYRAGSHSSSDDPSAYRSKEEEEAWTKVDGLKRMITHAQWRKIWTQEETQQTEIEATETISELIKTCESWPPPKVESLFDDVYERIPSHLMDQRESYLKYLRDNSN